MAEAKQLYFLGLHVSSSVSPAVSSIRSPDGNSLRNAEPLNEDARSQTGELNDRLIDSPGSWRVRNFGSCSSSSSPNENPSLLSRGFPPTRRG